VSHALFSAPIRATNNVNGLPILLLGTTSLGEVLAVDDDGRLVFVQMADVRVEWRYNWRDQTWNEVDDGAEDDAPDGGEDFSGSVSEPDGDGPSDPFNPEGGSATGDPGDVDTGEEGR
jgi:hypothetical protein